MSVFWGPLHRDRRRLKFPCLSRRNIWCQIAISIVLKVTILKIVTFLNKKKIIIKIDIFHQKSVGAFLDFADFCVGIIKCKSFVTLLLLYYDNIMNVYPTRLL